MIQLILTVALGLIVLFTITSLVAGWPLPGSIGFAGRRR